MAIKLKKNGTAETTVEKVANGTVLTSSTTQEKVTPVFKEQAGLVPQDKEVVFKADKDLHIEHQLAEMGNAQWTAGAGQLMSIEPPPPYCEVGFEVSYTHNLGNYESAKIGVSLKLPCLVPEIDEAFEYAKTWVDEKMNQVNAELKAE
jgi:hypothetical protein